MERWNIFLAALCLCVSVLPTIHGQLSTNEKQALLDLHNELRGAAGGADVVQSVSARLNAPDRKLIFMHDFCRLGKQN